ncbi:type II toxin-antitoxin system death-on-curing family toxin [Anaerocolumna xylanovorans]
MSNHPFIDGNKRIGILVMLVFLDINQISINCEDGDIINLGLGVADGRYDSSYIMKWIINHSTN